MRVQVIMPQMGESIVEGTVVAWKKKVGDKVRRDEDIYTISTDKVDAEIPSPSDGVLVEVLASVGQTVVVGAIVGWLETDEAAATTAVASGAPKAASAPAAAGARRRPERAAHRMWRSRSRSGQPTPGSDLEP